MTMLVSMKRISTALGSLALMAAPALAAPPSQNQATADAVAGSLRANPALAAAPVRIETRQGLVTLSGVVASPELKAEAVARARATAGVTGVIDGLRLAGDPAVQPVRYNMGHGHGGMMAGPAMGGEMVGGPVAGGAAMGGAIDGPMPEGPAIPGGTQAAQPGAPNYAWPSYAPAGNFSAVGYPTVYPWQAWPNIGPFYPYPEVPLDWRAVTLRWDDGLWWLDFRKNYTRPFFTPYPFGLFAY
jgi:hypothetical protein